MYLYVFVAFVRRVCRKNVRVYLCMFMCLCVSIVCHMYMFNVLCVVCVCVS